MYLELLDHELLDRCFSMCEMFNTLVLEHPSTILSKKEKEEVSEILGNLYQKVGARIAEKHN